MRRGIADEDGPPGSPPCIGQNWRSHTAPSKSWNTRGWRMKSGKRTKRSNLDRFAGSGIERLMRKRRCENIDLLIQFSARRHASH
jgi:hypothetical protein